MKPTQGCKERKKKRRKIGSEEQLNFAKSWSFIYIYFPLLFKE